MIGYIKGQIEEVDNDLIVLDHNGMGYRIFVPASFFDRGYRIGDTVKIYTYLSVREDAMLLYGFLNKDDLEIYKLLLNVSGIGPKGAMGVLSALSADTLRFAILSEDAATIAKAPGIGKKTAQKLILELKDKFSLEDAFEKKMQSNLSSGTISSKNGTNVQDAISALTALGYSASEAMNAVRKVDPSDDMDTEDILKAALKNIF